VATGVVVDVAVRVRVALAVRVGVAVNGKREMRPAACWRMKLASMTFQTPSLLTSAAFGCGTEPISAASNQSSHSASTLVMTPLPSTSPRGLAATLGW
jgi:hypothetical protein